jgi:hypothetical protein
MRLCRTALFVIFITSTAVPAILAQGTKDEATLPDAPVATAPERPYSRVDVFAGFSFLTVHGEILGYKFSETHNGPIVGASYFITRNFGVEGQFTFSSSGSTNCFSSAQGGPIVRFFAGSQLSIYAHADAGETNMGIRDLQDCAWNPSVAAGGGIDYIFAGTGNHVAFRLIQADYQYVRLKYNFLDLSGTTNVNVPRFSTGLTIRLEDIEPPAVKIPRSFECNTNPSEAYAGERVVLAALANGYDFAKPYNIHWTSTGGTVVYPGPDVLLDTFGLAPGSYTATAQLTHGKNPTALATCNAPFTLKPPPSLTVQCTADPASINDGDSTTIKAQGMSGANRKLTYSFTTSAGQIRADGPTARLVSGGAETITVSCRAKDDLGQKAEATAMVHVKMAPEPPAAPTTPQVVHIGPPAPPPATAAPAATQPLTAAAQPTVETPPLPAWAADSEGKKILKGCSLSFENTEGRKMQLAAPSITCLDEIAVVMQQRPGTRLTLVGNHAQNEANGASQAAQRASVSKTFLEEQRGIDPSRIDVRTGSSTTRSVETYVLAPGVVFDPPPTEQHKELE